MLNHSFIYLFAQGIPGLLNFLALALYTRLLLPDDYGRYGLVIAGVSFANALVFYWIRNSLGRFYPAHTKDPQVLLSTITAGFLAMVAVTGVLGAGAIIFWPDPTWRGFIALGLILLWVQAWYELSLAIARAKLQPRRFGVLSFVKAVLGLVLGLGLVFIGLKAYGPLLGIIIGMTCVAALSFKHEWGTVQLNKVDKTLGKELIQYGFPLTGIAILSFLIASSDRFILNYISGIEAAGLYSASYDLPNQTLGLLMMVVNLAAFPLAMRALEDHGVEAVHEQLKENIIMLLAIALPATTGFILCTPNIAEVVLGEQFRETAIVVIPWVVIGAFIAGMKSYYIDISFYLAKNTLAHMWIVGITAIVNIVFNVWWIPSMGVLGAAYATVVAYTVGAIMSWIVGHRVFPIPLPPKEAWKVILSTTIMGLSLWPLLPLRGLFPLLGQVIVGGIVYSTLFIALNIAQSRTMIMRLLTARRK